MKDRIPKSYRLKELDDKIRKRRTKSETKLLEKASKIINAPNPLTKKTTASQINILTNKKSVSKANPSRGGGGGSGGEKTTKSSCPLSLEKNFQNILILSLFQSKNKFADKSEKSISKLHDKDIIHGDLTTSNMILKDNKVFFIDFGLGFISHKYEDKAVDLHLLKQALEAKHFKHGESLFKRSN